MLLLGAAVVGVAMSPLRDYISVEWVRDSLSALRETVEGFWWSPLAFIALYAVGSILLLPSSPFLIAAGVIWGWKLATLYCMVGGMIGAVASFEVSRWLLGDLVRSFVVQRAPRLVERLEGAGITTVAILRMIPGVPFVIFNYGAGLASLSLKNYTLGTLIGLLVPVGVITYSADALLAGTVSAGEALVTFVKVALLMALLILLPKLLRRFLGDSADVTAEMTADADQTAGVVN